MKTLLMTGLALASLASLNAYADDANAPTGTATNNGNWTGTGEIGFSNTTGNSRSQNLNAKLTFNQETQQWKNNVFADVLREKGTVSVTNADGSTYNAFESTANRYDFGASAGYKLDPRSYIVSAFRYDHDDFAANHWQGTVSIGYGYMALKTAQSQLSFEIGPGFTEYQPTSGTITLANGETYPYSESRQEEAVARGLINYAYAISPNAKLTETFLTEAGVKNSYFQNDVGVQVTITKKFSVKLGFQVRHNTHVLPDIRKTDTLATTNLAYSF